MIIAETIDEVRRQVSRWKGAGLDIGLVPTMGYLHGGHASLVDKSVSMCGRTVVSVFVNPEQFGPDEDLDTYPRDFERDCELLKAHGCDMVFHPPVSEMYPDGGTATYVGLVNDMPKRLCGKTRPIHFRGVCTVVAKLFNIVRPDMAFFGQKDAQQLIIIRRMAKDLSYGIRIVGCPIVREADGLAKSSRNAYLNPKERRAAAVLSRAVFLAEDLFSKGERDASVIVAKMRALIGEEPLARVEYICAVDVENLEPVSQICGETLIAMAVHIGKTRLIDNTIVGHNDGADFLTGQEAYKKEKR